MFYASQPSSASSPPSTSVSVDTPKPYQRSCRVSRAVWGHSCDQILVHQPPASRAVDEAIQSQQRVTGNVPIIEPEGEFVNVPAKMLRADVVESAIDAPLQDAQTLSMLLVVTPSRAYSPALWLIVSCSKDVLPRPSYALASSVCSVEPAATRSRIIA